MTASGPEFEHFFREEYPVVVRTLVPIVGDATEAEAVAQDAFAKVDRLDLEQAIATLSAQQRAAIVLHHLAGWPIAEVADALGCAEATVRVHLHRGRRALAVALHEDDDDTNETNEIEEFGDAVG
jgi:DNA-directed RNA polymerase specialized sigma24 family protein